VRDHGSSDAVARVAGRCGWAQRAASWYSIGIQVTVSKFSARHFCVVERSDENSFKHGCLQAFMSGNARQY